MLTPELITLGRYLAGEFENQKQAIAEPIWYVHLILWLRPVPLFTEDSLTLFAEQANIVKLDQPYRPRLLRLRQMQTSPLVIEVQHYMFNDIRSIQGAGRNPQRLQNITLDEITVLPTCNLAVNLERFGGNNFHFKALPTSNTPCSFTYEGATFQVSLGFEVSSDELKTYDKGIDPNTGQGIWGAMMGPYCYTKRQDFSSEWQI
ncbi:chorismate mutase [Aphanothece hegewaldii CCALA 016]|uniref:Chromophore lyase CpcT/CpeT n=1 Tax=Aphanothece hegewaldii CCALA 016 TaxID=2107694 RepID=A0A2T1LTR0_9CHRO|nr:chromophore lyase CpcT/CpeT [Aphanothece hegewaldii]PSF34490.1 chorismate mutase [Aphanothece hegewaldii CCALA 016]